MAYFTQEEFTVLYEKFVSTVYKICFMYFKNSSETEDAVQNTFLKLFKQDKEQFKSDEHIKAWLIVTCKNECKNALTHWFRSKRNDLPEGDEALGSYTQNILSTEVSDALSRLPDKYKIPVYLYYYEGYKTDEIAAILKINHSTLRTNLAKAREILKDVLEEGSNE